MKLWRAIVVALVSHEALADARAGLAAFAGGQRPHPTAPMPVAGDAESVAAYLSASSR